jgi:hypothetical protein
MNNLRKIQIKDKYSYNLIKAVAAENTDVSC